jgi:4-hydroxybenzoate polyprenyltransferase
MGPFLHFYIPLAMTSLLTLVVQPIGSAALSRMPDALDSLAVWPVVTGVIFMLRSAGLAYNEVVVALLDQRNARENLRKFAKIIGAVTTAFLLLVVSTPLSDFWFRQVSALPPSLADMARRGLWIAILMPIFSVLQSWFQGNILHSQKTRGISEAVVVFLITIGIVLGIGIAWNQITGLYVGLAAYVLGYGTQDVWLWLRSRPALKSAS